MGVRRRQNREKGGDHILSVKGNQSRKHDEIRDQFAFALRQLDPGNLDPQRWSFAQTKDHGHDRGKNRRNSLPKREMRAALNPAYLEQLLSLV
jgi:hypothetical protein